LADEKDFCTLLSELIIDERKAPKDYQMLLDLFDEEKELLLKPETRGFWQHTIKSAIEIIIKEEQSHEATLEDIRKITCVPEEK